ncbi:DNA endonuclease [Thermococcus sp. EP1]|uniref:LAGLIDADG family homing endonuclease n=1 Tax=Thermococcus sp. EP1 TaxID=1591054 RepID=UPI0006DAB3D8|nr:LAGLIDADG family homing endonuclease [Thermococcus sp. EP1]KPU63942.1 DNA endonuclease [Thermococcus sp. EP1]
MRSLRDLGQEELQELLGYINELRKRGLNYSQIAKRIMEEKGIKISRVTVARWCKGEHNPFNKIKFVNLEPSPSLAYIIGVYFGDASISLYEKYKYRVRLKVVDKEFAEAFKDALADIGANPRVEYEKDKNRSNRWCVEATSKSLYMFLKQPKEKLFEIAKEYPKEFLRGFFDSEGYVYVDKHAFLSSYIAAYNYDLEVLEFSQGLLSFLSIHSKIRVSKEGGTPVIIRGKEYFYKSNLYELRIYRVESVRKFAIEIGFTIQRKQEKLNKWLKTRTNESF